MIYPLDQCRNQIISELKKIIKKYKVEIKLETPPKEMSDFAFPCFSLAPFEKKSPKVIAEDLVKKIKKNKWIENVDAKGGYVNFFINNTEIISQTLQSIIEMKDQYGYLQKKKQKVIIEHTSANPNGPLHVGRARNPIIGDTLVRIFKAAGYNVESQFYLDDMGKQVAILAWGVNNLNSNDVPLTENEKPDHIYVGYYQTANKKMEQNDQVNQEISQIIKN